MSFSPALQRAAVLQRPATIDVVTAGPGMDFFFGEALQRPVFLLNSMFAVDIWSVQLIDGY